MLVALALVIPHLSRVLCKQYEAEEGFKVGIVGENERCDILSHKFFQNLKTGILTDWQNALRIAAVINIGNGDDDITEAQPLLKEFRKSNEAITFEEFLTLSKGQLKSINQADVAFGHSVYGESEQSLSK